MCFDESGAAEVARYVVLHSSSHKWFYQYLTGTQKPVSARSSFFCLQLWPLPPKMTHHPYTDSLSMWHGLVPFLPKPQSWWKKKLSNMLLKYSCYLKSVPPEEGHLPSMSSTYGTCLGIWSTSIISTCPIYINLLMQGVIIMGGKCW